MQDFYELVEHEESLKAVEKNLSGSRPKELFEDVLEEVEEQYIKDRNLLRDAKDIVITPETSFDDFSSAVDKDGKLSKVSAVSR